MPYSNPHITIRRATGTDMRALLKFVAQTYGKGAPFKNLARHLWQFENTPYRPAGETEPTIWLALDGARVVGEIAVQDGAMRIQGKLVPAGWVVDVMVHPDYRGMGLSHRIHDAVLQDRQVLFTLTMAPATRRVAERADCLTLGPTRQFILPHRLSAKTVTRFLDYKANMSNPRRARMLNLFTATRVGPLLVAGGARLAANLRRLRVPAPSGEVLKIIEVDRFPTSIDDLWTDHRDDFPGIFERSARFLNWRFVEAPGLTYRRFLLERGGAPKGYLVTRLGVAEELPLGVIADVFAGPEDAAGLDALLAQAFDVLSPDVEYIEAAASTPAWQAALRRAGFIATRTMRPTVVCTNTNLRANLAQIEGDWHFTKADHDWDQVHTV
ncbi:GNAT family N-acetyltransferase [Rhodobacteraceae bacterium KMM 6894]|nr:GNAT family N-acetyltransferase [Rhodobacteraceae bacterium KMM 6894]